MNDHRAEAERLLSEADGNVTMMTTTGLSRDLGDDPIPTTLHRKC